MLFFLTFNLLCITWINYILQYIKLTIIHQENFPFIKEFWKQMHLGFHKNILSNKYFLYLNKNYC